MAVHINYGGSPNEPLWRHMYFVVRLIQYKNDRIIANSFLYEWKKLWNINFVNTGIHFKMLIFVVLTHKHCTHTSTHTHKSMLEHHTTPHTHCAVTPHNTPCIFKHHTIYRHIHTQTHNCIHLSQWDSTHTHTLYKTHTNKHYLNTCQSHTHTHTHTHTNNTQAHTTHYTHTHTHTDT